ncbi:Myb- protein B [Mortierella sp. 14UC]|nr:Myb- protein B [Mortierella sp. 14UC]
MVNDSMQAMIAPKRRERDSQADAEARNTKRKRHRFSDSMDDETEPSPSPYKTRSRSERLPPRSRPTSPQLVTPLKSRERSVARQQSSRQKTSQRGGDRPRAESVRPRKPRDLHDSGFVLGDADQDQQSSSPPRSRKKGMNDWRKDWLEARAVLTRKFGKGSHRKKRPRKLEVHASYSQGHRGKEQEDESRMSSLSSDTDSGDANDNNDEGDSHSSALFSSELSVTSTSSSSFSGDEKGVFGHGRPVHASRSNIKAGPSRTRAGKSSKLAATKAPPAAPTTAASSKTTTGTPPDPRGHRDTIRPQPSITRKFTPSPSPEFVSKSTSRRPRRPATTTQPQQRSRSPRQIRLKTGRWTKEEDEALFRGVVEYLAQHGLEPKPPAHLPMDEDPQQDMDDQEQEEQVEEKRKHQAVMQIVQKRLVAQRQDVDYGGAKVAAADEYHQDGNGQGAYNQGTLSSADSLTHECDSDSQIFDELVDVSSGDVHTNGHHDELLIPEAGATKHQAPIMTHFRKGFSVDQDPVLFGDLPVEDQLLLRSTTAKDIVASFQVHAGPLRPQQMQQQQLQKTPSIVSTSGHVTNQAQTPHPPQNQGPEIIAPAGTPSRSVHISNGNFQQMPQQQEQQLHQQHQQHIQVQQPYQQHPQHLNEDTAAVHHHRQFIHQQQQQQLHQQQLYPLMQEHHQQGLHDHNLRQLQYAAEVNLNQLVWEHEYQRQYPHQHQLQQHQFLQQQQLQQELQFHQPQQFFSRDQNQNWSPNPNAPLHGYYRHLHHLMANRPPTHYHSYNYNQHPTTVVTSLPFWQGEEEANMMTVRDAAGENPWFIQGSRAAIGGERLPVMGDDPGAMSRRKGHAAAAAAALVASTTTSVAPKGISALEAVEMALFDELLTDYSSPTVSPQGLLPSQRNHSISNKQVNNAQQDTTATTQTPHHHSYDAYISAISRRLQSCPWSLIASFSVPGRTGVQAQARYSEALDPLVKKGPWSAQEDTLLMEGVGRAEGGRCWIWIADGIRGRTQRQCRTRWVQLRVAEERRAALKARDVLRGVTKGG